MPYVSDSFIQRGKTNKNSLKINPIITVHIIMVGRKYFLNNQNNSLSAADFSLLNLPKGKSPGRSKPATNS
jgi:hypothetical protein